MKIEFRRNGRGLYVAHDSEGKPLPCQASVVVQQRPDDVLRATVEFIVDDDDVVLCDSRK